MCAVADETPDCPAGQRRSAAAGRVKRNLFESAGGDAASSVCGAEARTPPQRVAAAGARTPPQRAAAASALGNITSGWDYIRVGECTLESDCWRLLPALTSSRSLSFSGRLTSSYQVVIMPPA